MLYLIIAIIALGLVTAIIALFSSKKKWRARRCTRHNIRLYDMQWNRC